MSQASSRPIRTFYFRTARAAALHAPDGLGHAATLAGAHAAATRRLFAGDYCKAIIYDVAGKRRYVLTRHVTALTTAGRLP